MMNAKTTDINGKGRCRSGWHENSRVYTGSYAGAGVLHIESLSVTRGSALILRDINLQVPAGGLQVVVGPNGGGKTTLLRALIGDIPSTGSIRLLNGAGAEIRPRIGYVPQKLEFDGESPISVLDLFGAGSAAMPVWLGHTRRFRHTVKCSLARVDAEHLLHRPLGRLSGGELQRVLLALALDPLPDLLLLDEPFANVDQGGMEKYYELIADFVREYRITALMVSHDLEATGRFASGMILLDGSIRACGTPQEVMDSAEFRKAFSPCLK